MNSRDASSPEQQGFESTPGPGAKTPEYTLKTQQLQVERKTFSFALRENVRGRFLCIAEESRGRREQIMIPAPGLPDISRVLEEMIKAATEIPSPLPSQSTSPPAEHPPPPLSRPARKRRRKP